MSTEPDDPRGVEAADFPLHGGRREQLRFLLNFAVLAPSSHNSQPWCFRLFEDGLDVLADRSRGLAVVDPHDRELTISCGAAIGTLEVAARHFGFSAAVESPGSTDDKDLVARVRLTSADAPSRAETRSFEAIKRRWTDRGPYSPDPPPTELLHRLGRDIAGLGVEMRPVSEASLKQQIADLVEEGDRAQFEDPRFRRELASWVHSRRLGSRDGMSSASFGMPDVLAPVTRLVIRTFDMGDGIAAADAEKVRSGSPVLSLLATPSDEPGDWTNTGRSLARVLLFLAARGLTASYLNQPIEVDSLRPRLKAVVGTEQTPQLLLRIGYGGKTVPTVRRPLAEVIVD